MFKKILLFSVLAFSMALTAPEVSFAQEDDSKRTANPGEDPNEARSGKSIEADVAATGACNECIARMIHPRLGDDTTYRPTGGSGGSSGSGASEGGTGNSRKGTR